MSAEPEDSGTGRVRWLDETEQRTWRSLMAVTVQLSAALDRQLRHDSGLSHIEYQVLAMLSESEGETLRMGRLAELVDATAPRASQVVGRLQDRGLLTRHADPDDGRVMLVTLSDLGRSTLQRAAPGHVAAVRELVFDPLTLPQARLLGELLAPIEARLEGENRDRSAPGSADAPRSSARRPDAS